MSVKPAQTEFLDLQTILKEHTTSGKIIFYNLIFSVFHQFQGRFGPTAVAVSTSDKIYVARFEFACKS